MLVGPWVVLTGAWVVELAGAWVELVVSRGLCVVLVVVVLKPAAAAVYGSSATIAGATNPIAAIR